MLSEIEIDAVTTNALMRMLDEADTVHAGDCHGMDYEDYMYPTDAESEVDYARR